MDQQTTPAQHPVYSYPTPDEVAKYALHHYEHVLPRKGKPQPDREFSVYACIVASLPLPLNSQSMWVVSCATGSKCCAVSSADLGRKLHDSHAEVLARRGLVRQLWMEVQRGLKRRIALSSPNNHAGGIECNHPNPQRLLDVVDRENGNHDDERHANVYFQLRKGLKLMCYISDSPCGDAAIYQTSSSLSSSDNLTFTGAKVIISEKTGVTMDQCIDDNQDGSKDAAQLRLSTSNPAVVVARECTQICGALRLKSGRSNIPDHLRSTSHSCSDKFCRWAILGLQGSLLSRWIPDPIVFHSIVVSADPRCDDAATIDTNGNNDNPQRLALHRAIIERTGATIDFLRNHIQQSVTVTDRIRRAALEWIDCIDRHNREALSVDIVAHQFSQGKTFVESSSITSSPLQHEKEDKEGEDREAKRRKVEKKGTSKKKFSAAGVSLNWQPLHATDEISRGDGGGNCIEVTVGASGRKQGKKPKSLQDFERCSSRLCRKKILDIAISCIALHPNVLDEKQDDSSSSEQYSNMSYAKFKERHVVRHVQLIRDAALFSGGPLTGWVTGTSSDFAISCAVAN